MVTIQIHYYKPALSIIDDDFISWFTRIKPICGDLI